MREVSFIICLLLSLSLHSQGKESTAQKTSDVLAQLTDQWKSDSIGLQGYRFDYFARLSKSKPDSVSKDQLLKCLGSPNRIRKTSFGRPRRDHVEYVYFILNNDPRGKSRPFSGLYLSFVFDEGEYYLEEIQEGEFCF